jgi:hypothetical protein
MVLKIQGYNSILDKIVKQINQEIVRFNSDKSFQKEYFQINLNKVI